MLFKVLLAIRILLIPTCLGVVQLQNCAAAESPQPLVPISGQVIDANGASMTGVEVIAKSRNNQLRTTSADFGMFDFEIPVNEISGLVLSAKHLAKQQTLIGQHRLPYVKPTKAVDEAPLIRLKVLPARQISLEVVDASNQPITGADVGLSIAYRITDKAVTDEKGQAMLLAPADSPLQFVWAAKPKAGFDYFVYRREGAPVNDPYQLPQDHDQLIRLKLAGAQTVEVFVVDEQERPMEGVRVHPWLIQLPDKGDYYNNPAAAKHFHKVTDQDGYASFDAFPENLQRPTNFWARIDGYFAPQRFHFDPKEDPTAVEAQLLPLVQLTGKVVTQEGAPVPGISVIASGQGYGIDRFNRSTVTNKQGEFEFQAYSNNYYHLAATSEKWSSGGENRVLLTDPIEDIELVVQPSTRVHGTMTAGSDREPNQHWLRLYRRSDQPHYQLPEDQRLPNPTGSNVAISSVIGWSSQTDERGQYEFFVGPGSYYMIGPGNGDMPKFEVTDQSELKFDIHSDLPEKSIFRGRVVLASDQKATVPEIRLEGYLDKSFGQSIRAVSDEFGKFEAYRGPTKMYLHARSKDRKLVALQILPPTAETADILVGESATAVGRLVDEESGEVLEGYTINYGVKISFTNGTYGTRFGGSVETDSQGEFELIGLVPNWEYDIRGVIDTDDKGRARGWSTLGKVTPRDASSVDLGDISWDAVD